MTFLEEIVAHKRLELAERMASRPLDAVLEQINAGGPAKNFAAVLRSAPARPALIAEIKRASPSQGLLAKDFNPSHLARIYHQNGAVAISVLTDAKYFLGDLAHLKILARQIPRPAILRKDFIFDPYQIYESRALGADSVLLIAAILPSSLLHELYALARQLGMVSLVEVHRLEELESVLSVEPEVIGINNRNLHSFRVDLQVTKELAPRIPAGVCVVSESGIQTSSDVAEVASAGVDAILVGGALMRASNVAEKVRELANVRGHEG